MRAAQTLPLCLLLACLALAQAWPWEKKDGAEQNKPSQQASGDIKSVTLTKSGASSFGFSLANVKRSLMISQIEAEGAAARAGLHFGDQVLTLNGNTPMGRPLVQVHQWMASQESLNLTYRAAPYTRLVVIKRGERDGKFGFEVDDDGQVDTIDADSPAVAAGLMTDHIVLSVNGKPTDGSGQHVVEEVTKAAGEVVLQIMPSNIYFSIENSNEHEGDQGLVESDEALEEDEEAAEGGMGSAIGGAVGGAVGAELANTFAGGDESESESEAGDDGDEYDDDEEEDDE